MTYLTLEHMAQQEAAVEETTWQNVGKGCDLHKRALNCLIRMVYWIPAVDASTDEGKFKVQARMWLHSAIQSFRAAQMLATTGYYLEAQIIHRHLIEVLVKMNYFYKHPGVLKDFQMKKAPPVQFKTMFDEVFPGYYEEYKYSLSYPSHGGTGASAYRVQFDSNGNRTLDTGVAYKEFWASAFINQQTVFLLGYLRTYLRIFPELMNALSPDEQQELKNVEQALEEVISEHVKMKGGENSWHKAISSIWNP